MYGLDLFSGIGGITKALDGYVRPVAYCEIEPYARAVLLSRMSIGDIPVAPIWHDVTTLHGDMLPRVDVIYGGFPCQDISVANPNGKGLDGKRSGLFFEIARLVSELRPSFVFLENSSAIRTRGLSTVVGELARLGYDCRWITLSSEEVGARQKRKRWFLLAHAKGRREICGDVRGNGGVPATSSTLFPGDYKRGGATGNVSGEWWKFEPGVGRVVDGVPERVDRLRALGNAVVPAQAREAFKRLMGV